VGDPVAKVTDAPKAAHATCAPDSNATANMALVPPRFNQFKTFIALSTLLSVEPREKHALFRL
jgi:hypothetical protein